MNRYIITVLIFLLTSMNVFAQPQWQFKSKIEGNTDYFLFEGNIADKYPITMYFEYCDGYSTFCLWDNRWNYGYRLKGWYYYDNRKKKLPLVGSIQTRQNDTVDISDKITLYVPTNVFDEVRENTCDLEEYKEIFITEKNQNEQDFLESMQMQWKLANSNSFLPVKLKKINKRVNKKTSILLSIKNIEMFSFNLTDKLSDELKHSYISNIDFKASKEINNDFYLIFSFSSPSQGVEGWLGHCGSGYEEYLGFLHISSFEVKEFKYFQISSCLHSFEKEYMYDENAPEKGITIINE